MSAELRMGISRVVEIQLLSQRDKFAFVAVSDVSLNFVSENSTSSVRKKNQFFVKSNIK